MAKSKSVPGSLRKIAQAKRLVDGTSKQVVAVARQVTGKIRGAGAGAAGKAKEVLGGGRGRDANAGAPRAVFIEETIDVGVPVSVAYDQWTQFEDFSQFTKGVESVDQDSDTEITWRAKVFKSRRTWTAKITEQIPDHRIAWSSDGAKASVDGVVTFHPLAEDLTRILLVLQYYPSGVVERTANMWRAAGRRARLDLKNFRRFVTMRNEATGSWRGEIHDGKVVKRTRQAAKRPAKKATARSTGNGAGRASSQPRKRPARKAAKRPAAKASSRSDTSDAEKKAAS